jgi:hypothetical protein
MSRAAPLRIVLALNLALVTVYRLEATTAWVISGIVAHHALRLLRQVTATFR